MSMPKPSKNEVFTISDDESTNDQPPVKIPKIEEEQVPPPLSPAQEVEYLRKRVAALEINKGDLEQRLKDAVHAAAAYKREKESMESLLDSKRGILDGSNQGQNNNLQKRLKEVNEDLANARNEINELFSKKHETVMENDKLKNDYITLKEDSDFVRNRLKAENEALKKELEDMKKKAEDANNVAISLANADFTGNSHLDVKAEEDELMRENFELKEQLNEAKQKEETAKNDMKVLEQQIGALNEDLFEGKRREEGTNNDMNELEKCCDTLKSALKESERIRKNANNAKRELERKIASSEAELERIKNDAKNTKHVLERKNADLKAELDKLKREAEETSTESEKDKDWENTCICGVKEERGGTLMQCDGCNRNWEHAECIYPRTMRAPEGEYYCHKCLPRPTVLSREEASAFQEGNIIKKRIKDIGEERKAMEKEIEKKVRAYKDGLKPVKKNRKDIREKSGVVDNEKEYTGRARRSNADVKKSKKSNDYKKMPKNEYSEKSRELFPLSGLSSSESDCLELKNIYENRRANSTTMQKNEHKLVTRQAIAAGDFIAELRGKVWLQEECTDRDPLNGVLHDHTFLFEEEGFGYQLKKIGNLIIDARKGGNFARYLRKSCKPNAELTAVMSGFDPCDLHFMIRAKECMGSNDEVTIKLEDGWKNRPRPAQGCGCEDKQNCEMERFFNQTTQNAAASSDESSK